MSYSPLTATNGGSTVSSGVCPELFLARRSAPRSSRAATTSVRQKKAATCSAVAPSLLATSRSAPASISDRATSSLPNVIATISGVDP